MPPTPCLLLLLLMLTVSAALPASATTESIYDTLRYYGFPPGLVPKDVVTKYDLNLNTGQFTVYLNTTCEFTAFNYGVQFKTKITGVVKKEEIKNIHGVEVRMMNFPADLKSVEMVEDDEEIEFSAGYTKVDFPVYYFYNIPECGCGFDCGQSVAGNRSSGGGGAAAAGKLGT